MRICELVSQILKAIKGSGFEGEIYFYAGKLVSSYAANQTFIFEYGEGKLYFYVGDHGK